MKFASSIIGNANRGDYGLICSNLANLRSGPTVGGRPAPGSASSPRTRDRAGATALTGGSPEGSLPAPHSRGPRAPPSGRHPHNSDPRLWVPRTQRAVFTHAEDQGFVSHSPSAPARTCTHMYTRAHTCTHSPCMHTHAHAHAHAHHAFAMHTHYTHHKLTMHKHTPCISHTYHTHTHILHTPITHCVCIHRHTHLPHMHTHAHTYTHAHAHAHAHHSHTCTHIPHTPHTHTHTRTPHTCTNTHRAYHAHTHAHTPRASVPALRAAPAVSARPSGVGLAVTGRRPRHTSPPSPGIFMCPGFWSRRLRPGPTVSKRAAPWATSGLSTAGRGHVCPRLWSQQDPPQAVPCPRAHRARFPGNM